MGALTPQVEGFSRAARPHAYGQARAWGRSLRGGRVFLAPPGSTANGQTTPCGLNRTVARAMNCAPTHWFLLGRRARNELRAYALAFAWPRFGPALWANRVLLGA